MAVIAGVAAIGAVVALFGAVIFFWQTQEAQRASRRALFDTERQVYLGRIRRGRLSALGLVVLGAILLGVNLAGSAIANPPPTPTPTPEPTNPPPTPQTATVTGAGTLGLRLRDAPNGNLIDYLQDGTLLTLLPDEPVRSDDGLEWRRVIDPQGREGWVATLYLTINP